jgi:hypothetical protein
MRLVAKMLRVRRLVGFRSFGILLHLRSIFITHDSVVFKLRLRDRQLILEFRLQDEKLSDSTLNLASFLDHHFLEKLLAKHTDRHDRTRPLATLVRGDLVRSVVALIAHAIIISSQAAYATPSGDESGNISDIS